jgi:hypothetical protein
MLLVGHATTAIAARVRAVAVGRLRYCREA